MAKLIAKCRIEAGDIVILAGEPVDKLDKKEIERLKGLDAIGEGGFQEPAGVTEASETAAVKIDAKKVEKGEGGE